MGFSRLFLFILFGFLFGIAVHSFFLGPLPFLFSIIAALAFGAGIVFWRTPYFLASLLAVVACGLGLLRFEGAMNSLEKIFTNNNVAIAVASEVKQSLKSNQFVGRTAEGKLWVIAPDFLILHFGDVIDGTCNLRRVMPSDPYFAQYATRGTGTVCFLDRARVTTHGAPIFESLWRAKGQALASINQLFTMNDGALLGGMLFGGSAILSKESADQFRAAGLTHLVAISGYNFSLLALFIIAFLELWYLPRLANTILTAVILVGFFILVGPSASAARALLMASLILVAKLLGRQHNTNHIFAVVAATLLAINPLSLRFDAGFDLSFAATATLLFFIPPALAWLNNFLHLETLTGRLLFWPTQDLASGFFEIIISSSMIMVTTAPVLWFFFGRVSLASVLANTLVAPMVPLVMIGGYILVVVSFLSMPTAAVLAWPLEPLVHYIISVAQFFS